MKTTRKTENHRIYAMTVKICMRICRTN